ncbi:LacI family transcriptional regulator [Capsulimonas corticalis]|uniref:LacI family transcriptional regulator n=1 Tax=Capsulimonas corticalis TaxID=2219043 RepID=A0A402CQ44_9BACT|nr:LacI family transcriptional regulator [Capsulimonas corticalis]
MASALRQEIVSGLWKSDERLPGELELARRFEVAHMTMRQAIANLVEEGVLLRVRGKGTYIVPKDQQPAVSRTLHPMALLFPSDSQRLDPYYFPELLEGFQRAMEEAGHRAAIFSDEIADTAHLLEPGSAIACLLFEDAQVQMIERLRDSGLRVLSINRYSGRRSIPSVYIDDAMGIGSAVDHLVGLGHERIGFVRGPATNFDAMDRLRGFRDAVKQHGLRGAVEAGEGFNEAAGYAGAIQMLTQSHRPTAIICASDLAALGAIKAARDLGLSVPRGLSIVGFGDFSVADYMLPALTTVRQARLALGRTAAESLIELASGKDISNVVLSADLMLRDSTSENLSALMAAR